MKASFVRILLVFGIKRIDPVRLESKSDWLQQGQRSFRKQTFFLSFFVNKQNGAFG